MILPVLGVLTFFVACVSSVTSRGPIFFRQEKVGLKGQRIRIYRFRTMRVRPQPGDLASTAAPGVEFADVSAVGAAASAKSEPLIPGGGFLRASGLADLPQIVNVLRGEMSIVGPQPRHEVEMPIPTSGQLELNNLPGITGLWRIARKNAKPTDDVSELDSAYAARKSLWLDSKIILLTIPALCIDVASLRKPRAQKSNGLPSPKMNSVHLPTTRQPW